MESVFDLAREDTQLKKVAASEYAGPCPNCGGRDRFHVNLTKRGGLGGWMCRVCRPAEIKGWGDDVDYLVAFRGMSMREALKTARDQVNTLLDQAQEARIYAAPDDDKPPRAPWQEKTREYVERAAFRLWSPAGREALEYARARGLIDSTIKAAQLGFSLDRDQNGNVTPFLTIPWHAGNGEYWAVNRRDMRKDKPDDAPRYKMLFGSSKQGLYGGNLLERSRKFASFLVEGEIDALILAQEARGLDINIVATGGQNTITTRWAVRLSRMPLVLLAQDNEEKGSDQARAWLDVLQSNAMRYRPLAKDVNAMHLEGWSVRTWVEAALDMLRPVEPTNMNRVLLPDQAPASSASDPDQSARTTPDQAGLVEQEAASAEFQDARVVAALPGAPADMLEDITALLFSLLDQDQAATWLDDIRAAWSARDVAALSEYGEQIDYPGALFVERLGLQVEQIVGDQDQDQIDQAASEQDVMQHAGQVSTLEQATSNQDAGAAFLDHVNALFTSAGVWPEGWSGELVDDEFAARIHALPGPDRVPARIEQPSMLEPLPRLKCPALVLATTDIPGETKRNRAVISRPCTQKAAANGWCSEHSKSAILLDMGAALGYPRVVVSDCNVIPAGRRGWERYAMTTDQSMKATLPRVKRLLDQAGRDQDQAAS